MKSLFSGDLVESSYMKLLASWLPELGITAGANNRLTRNLKGKVGK